ncbi:hypothetical protein B0A52_02920 [Exophiala mesophila]|uniref:Uncharacterized protein n=1 Tax=Exophiala mesophila TaxID=212818 RepID=A0A438NBW7_EXOME|nr:hypothetical protein B0A52_02920 [Exophiala mesophila]
MTIKSTSPMVVEAGDVVLPEFQSIGGSYADYLTDLTWSGHVPLPTDVVDYLILKCDQDRAMVSATHDLALSTWDLGHHSPFSCFQLQPKEQSIDSSDQFEEVLVDFENIESPSLSNALILMPSISENPDLTWDDQFLFDHYVRDVGSNMMPVEHARNPWKSDYPALALGRTWGSNKILYHAIISHAAFHLAHMPLRDANKYALIGSKNYAIAIHELRLNIDNDLTDFATTVASILSLMFAEIYSGRSRYWRHHHEGAWKLVESHRSRNILSFTDFTRILMHNLNIARTISQTATGLDQDLENGDVSEATELSTTPSLSAMISSSPAYGFTIGASGTVLDCISKITRLQHVIANQQNDITHHVDETLESILSQLNCCRNQTLGDMVEDEYANQQPSLQTLLERSQNKAFIYATYIYLYRTLFDVPPRSVRGYVAETLRHVDDFFSLSGGNFSIWPAFIAAVEAYTVDDMAAARRWLERSTSFGMGNRESVEKVVREVWRTREERCEALDIDLGIIAVDWREVMREMDCDVLLV